MRRAIPIALSFIFGVTAIVVSLVVPERVQSVTLALTDTWQIIFTCGLLVGVAAFLANAFGRIARNDDRFYNAVMLAGAVVMPALALWGGLEPGSPFVWVFENIQAPMQSTVFALLAFFVASAAFRGMRSRNAPATVLLITALLVIIGRLPLIDSHLPALSDFILWIREYPSSAAKAGLLVGVALGSVTTALRVILGVERPYLGER